MAKLSPVFNDQTFDINGNPANGYQLFTYAANSSTKQTTFSDEAGTVPNTNPIIINSAGYPTQGSIFLAEGVAYKMLMTYPNDTDPPTSVFKEFDYVTGVGDNTVSVSQWVSSGLVPTYISPTSFSVPGDQTTAFQPGRREQFTVGSGTVYGNILSSVFTTLTTVTMEMDTGQALDAGLSAVNHSILLASPSAEPTLKTQSFAMVDTSIIVAKGATIVAASTTSIFAATDGNLVDISGDTGIASFGVSDRAGYIVEGTFTGSPLLTQSANFNLNNNGQNIQIRPGDKYRAVANSTSQIDVTITRKSGYPVSGAQVPVRQTVLNGPVDTSGFSTFGGATGTATVTLSSTLTITSANGNDNRVGYLVNPSWSGLSTNGTMYLYGDIAADGSATAGSTTIAPIYRWGGADITTNGQFVYNIQEAIGKVGNGSVASQTYRVFVGEVTVAGGVVTAITWYALKGGYIGQWVTPLPAVSTTTTITHNLGIPNVAASQQVKPTARIELECITANAGSSIGDSLVNPSTSATGGILAICPIVQGNVAYIQPGATNAFVITNSGTATALTAASWKYRFRVERGW